MTLHRAIITLPGFLSEPRTPAPERVVFFDSAPYSAYRRLEQLADTVWRIASSSWGQICFLQELVVEAALLGANARGAPETGDLRLLELGTSFFDARGARYATAEETVLLVDPQNHSRLTKALAAAAQARFPGGRA
ncbi:hypothetical protein GN316_15435 [Xylophilus sp. Kf1]|nr:hypothetical protein [Xylophilus sp. Kf1]